MATETPPPRDPPSSGKCESCGAYANALWFVARDKKLECKSCIRGVMRKATWPFTIRFPDELV